MAPKKPPPAASSAAPGTAAPPYHLGVERRAVPRDRDDKWRTAITKIEPNKILVRGYALDELIGRVGFGEAIYLILTGDLPTPAIGRMVEALLVSSIDHGATPPSTLAALNVATSGGSLRASVASGILAFGRYHGGDIEACMRFLDRGLRLVRAEHLSYEKAAAALAEDCRRQDTTPPGFGHRFHTRDPRAARLFQMALELELEGAHIQMIRALERAFQTDASRPLPVNVDGAIAAIAGDLGIPVELGNAFFIMSRVPGIIAHVFEEQMRGSPLRQIDPKDHVYDGPAERRLPETRR